MESPTKHICGDARRGRGGCCCHALPVGAAGHRCPAATFWRPCFCQSHHLPTPTTYLTCHPEHYSGECAVKNPERREVQRWQEEGPQVSRALKCPAHAPLFHQTSSTKHRFKDTVTKNFKTVTTPSVEPFRVEAPCHCLAGRPIKPTLVMDHLPPAKHRDAVTIEIDQTLPLMEFTF